MYLISRNSELPMFRMKLEITIFILLVTMLQSVVPYFITVDAHAEDCFFDKVQNGTKLGKIN